MAPMFQRRFIILERVQNKATQQAPGLSDMPYQDWLKKLDLPTLFYRRYRGDMIKEYTFLYELYDVDHSTLISLHNRPGRTTRGHCLKLQKKTCKNQLRQSHSA